MLHNLFILEHLLLDQFFFGFNFMQKIFLSHDFFGLSGNTRFESRRLLWMGATDTSRETGDAWNNRNRIIIGDRRVSICPQRPIL